MQYREFGKTGERVSVLGFGCMRFPGKDGAVDVDEAVRMMRYAMDNGVNYLDTAYFYHDGKSEEIVGKALKNGYRDKTLLATKSPIYSIKAADDFDRFLDTQRKRLDTDVIDFYLLHAVNRNDWENVVLKFGLLDKMQKAKDAGVIRHIGFSFHDNLDAFLTIVDGYDSWEFCQIQMNYVDVKNQAQMAGMEYAAKKGLGVIIMEPLRGGKLACPPSRVQALFPDEKPPVEWALDFLWNRPEVGIILSGMSSMEQVQQNLAYADAARVGMLDAQMLSVFDQARKVYETTALVPCTKCAYCMPCPFGLDIPAIYEAYNASALGNRDKVQEQYEAISVRADACKACKKCEARCPQAILSSQVMPQIAKFFTR